MRARTRLIRRLTAATAAGLLALGVAACDEAGMQDDPLIEDPGDDGFDDGFDDGGDEGGDF